MVMSVTRYIRKPMPVEHTDQVAARYTPGEPLDDLETVATMIGGTVYEVPYRRSKVLVAVWDDDEGQPRSQVVRPGFWLAYSTGHGFLYDSSDADWRQFYDEVPQ
jgi:hypothetical protein